MSKVIRTIGAAGVVALVVAQIALAEVPVSRFTAADQAAARAAVLRLGDFGAGSGWQGGLVKNAKAFTGDDCPGLFEPKQSDLVITGVAKSDFRADGAHAGSGAQVYKTSGMAHLDWDRTVAAPAALTCLRRHAAAANTPEIHFVSMKQVPFARVGERTFRIRTTVDYTPKPGATPLRVLTDDVLFGRGRTGIAFSFTIAYKFRADADAAELRIARLLNGRIRV